MRHFWTVDFELTHGTPALDTAEQQAEVAIELASTWHLPDAREMRRLLDAGRLTTECTINGKHVSLVLQGYDP